MSRTPGRTSTRYVRDLRGRETCAAAGVRSDGVRLYSACRQKDPLVKCDRHPLERVGRLTDYSVVPHPARDCDYFEGRWRARRPRFPAIGPACSEAFPASGVGKGPGRSNTKRCSRSGSDAETPRGAPADVIQSQLFDMCSFVWLRGFCTLQLAALAASLPFCPAAARCRCSLRVAAAARTAALAGAACAGGLRGLNPVPPAASGAAKKQLQRLQAANASVFVPLVSVLFLAVYGLTKAALGRNHAAC